MGAWGTGLYQDDITCDIKDEYLDLLRVGYSNIDATSYLIEHNTNTLSDEEETPLFWFALADTQHKYGRLLPEVKNEALKYIDLGTDLERWKDTGKQYHKRKDVLDKLKEKLNSPQPEKRKVTKLKMQRAKWKTGDILLYQIDGQSINNNEWHNKFVLIEIVGIARWNIGSLPMEKYYHETNLAVIYNWVGDSEPSIETIKKFNFSRNKNMELFPFLYKMNISFNNREIKKSNMKVIFNRNNNNFENIMSGVGFYWESSAEKLNESIIIYLNEISHDNNLVYEAIKKGS